MFQLLTIVTTITGIFTILDLFIEENAKAKVAEFVFGFGDTNFSGFESNAIRALLSPFKINGRLSYKRIFFRYSCLISVLLTIFALFLTYVIKVDFFKSSYDSVFLEALELLVSIPLVAVLFWPFDCWSLKVTDKIFGSKQSSSALQFIGRVVADVLITLLPLALVAAGLYLLVVTSSVTEGTQEYTVLMAVFVGISIFIVLNVFGSLFVTIVQLLTLGIGVFLRVILRLTKLNQHIAMISRAHEFPFTFMGLVLGVIISISAIAFT